MPQSVGIPSVSACAPGTLCPAPTLRYGRYLPAALLGALFLLRKHAPYQHSSRSSLRVAYTGSYSSASPPQNCSFLPPPAAVTVLPPLGHARIPSVERHAPKKCPSPARDSSPCVPQSDRSRRHPSSHMRRRIPSAERHSAGACSPTSVILSAAKDPVRQPAMLPQNALPPHGILRPAGSE